jgi:hypothetical protein
MKVIHAFSAGEEVEPDHARDWHTLFRWIFHWRSRFARRSHEDMSEPAALTLVLECATRHANELEITARREGVLGHGRRDVVRGVRSAIEKLTRYETVYRPPFDFVEKSGWHKELEEMLRAGITDEATLTRTLKALEYLEDDIREKDVLIASLLRTLERLMDTREAAPEPGHQSGAPQSSDP